MTFNTFSYVFIVFEFLNASLWFNDLKYTAMQNEYVQPKLYLKLQRIIYYISQVKVKYISKKINIVFWV